MNILNLFVIVSVFMFGFTGVCWVDSSGANKVLKAVMYTMAFWAVYLVVTQEMLG